MLIKQMQVGQIGTNCYILGDEVERVCAVIDPGDQAQQIAQAVLQTGMDLQAIFITHGHFDHVLGVPGLCEAFPDAKVYIHKKEANLTRTRENYMQMFPVENMYFYDEGDTLTLGSLTIHVMNTPGHSPGSMVLQVEDALFCGDTLFQGSCGRTDFAGGSYPHMLHSLKRLAELPGDFRVFPGHERLTTLEQERQNNYYMQEATKG